MVITLVSLLVLLLVSLVIFSRFWSVPGAVSLAAFLSIVIPAGLCSLPIGALIDRFLPDRNAARASVAITLWLMVVTAAIIAWPDVFGLLLLKHNRPAGLQDAEIAIGVIGSHDMVRVVWRSVALPATLVGGRLGIAAGAAVLAAVVAALAGQRFMRAISVRPRFQRSTVAISTSAGAAGELPRVRPCRVGTLRSAYILVRHWLTGHIWMWALIALTIVLSVALPNSHRIVVAAALMLPLLIADARRIPSNSQIRQLEFSVPAVWRPSPSLFAGFVLAGLTAFPTIATLSGLRPLHAIHTVAGIAALALWLVWTCAGIAKPLLGISVYALVWYVSVFCDIPPQADLLGVGGTAVSSLGATLSACLVLGILLHRRNHHEYRSRHFVR
jgi:hypothetical protein